MIRRKTASSRGRYSILRSTFFDFGMACIGLEDTLAGGGTYSIHAPKWLFAHEEGSIQNLLIGACPKRPGENLIRRARARFLYYEHVRHPLNHTFGSWAPRSRVHLWARRVAVCEGRIVDLEYGMDKAQRLETDRFLEQWLFKYLGIRGADGSNGEEDLGE